MKAAFYTLGCKVNQYESQAMAQNLEKHGFVICDASEDADVYVINSCTVTAESDRKTRQSVRRFKKLHPDSLVLLTGCMPQAFPQAGAELESADIVIGNKSNHLIHDYIMQYINGGGRIVAVDEHKSGEAFNGDTISSFRERTRANVKIEDGCNRFCSYCIIPYARGKVRSKPIEELKAEISQLEKNGFCEIVLVGINLSAYGTDNGSCLAEAVETAAQFEGIKRIRLGSLEPDHMSDDLLQKLASEPLFCPQFHLALQSGSDSTLARMNRHYDTAFFADIVSRIRKSFTNPSITTDVMVGFPAESEENFAESVHFVEEIGFARSHVFAYSRRSGTVAAGLPEQISENEKSRRAGVMAAAAARAEKKFLDIQVGLTEAVLFEQRNGDYFEGYTKNYTRVKVKSDLDLGGKIKDVRLVFAEDDYCLGEII
jgi:threonylcarbamoyladenosine tRNA methylthiotransferase MtaB